MLAKITWLRTNLLSREGASHTCPARTDYNNSLEVPDDAGTISAGCDALQESSSTSDSILTPHRVTPSSIHTHTHTHTHLLIVGPDLNA